jgi:hypothetical protein
MLTTPITRALLPAEAATFAVAASIHFGAFLPGYAHRRAGIAETVIAVILLAGAALSFATPTQTARSAFLGAQAFAALGVCVGLFTIAIGVGPRTVPDVVYHVAILATLIAGLACARRTVAPR